MGLKKYNEEEVNKKEEELEEALKAKEEALNNGDELEELETETIEESLPLSVDEEEIAKAINEERKKYLDFYNKQKKIRRFSGLGMLVVFIGAFVMIILSERMAGTGLWIGLALFILGLIASWIISKISKDKLSVEAQKYISKLFDICSKYLFDDENITDLVSDPNKQISLETFTKTHFYKNIKNVRDRNYVSFTYKGKQMIYADLAASIIVKNRTSPMFLGKFYSYDYSSYKKEDGIITFQLKGKELSRPLDDLDGLTERENEKRYVIYSNDDDYKKILTDRVKQDLLRFKIDKTLIDVIVSIRYEHVDIGIDYSDEFINIPVESEFKIEDLRKTKEDFKKVLQIIDDLSRN